MKPTSSHPLEVVCSNRFGSPGPLAYLHLLGLLTLLLVMKGQHAVAQSFPPNFVGVQIATGLDPVGMDVAPDGRIFITEKSGKIRIVKNGTLLTTPFVTIPNVDNYNERGLQGIVLDPAFSSNGYLYVYYAYKPSTSSSTNNRVVRYTANGDLAMAGSELVLLDIDPLSSAGIHNGGSLAFKDGKLLITVGENASEINAQLFTSLKGKVLRMNPDGSIPTDNPYYNSATGINRLIYALGFRNPFRIAVQPGTGKVFLNDVGNSSFEEVNEVLAGKNYGWSIIEGYRTGQTPPANYQDPFYAYPHDGTGCAVTAGEFYNPSTNQFPAQYVGKYFFADYCGNYIKTIDPATGAVGPFATGIYRPLAIKVIADGSLYFISRGGVGGGSDSDNTSSNGGGVLWKLTYAGNGVPVVSVQPSDRTVSVGDAATFSVIASGTPAPSYQWYRNGSLLNGATSASYVLPSASLSDNGAVFKVVVSNSAGTVSSTNATLTVLTNQKPVASITTPTVGKTYTAGDVIQFSGTGTDPDEGTLPVSALTWRVDFYHYDNPAHFHPVLAATSGISSGSFSIPVSGETSPNVLYRISLTVTDSKGATTTSTVDVNPIKAVLTVASLPAGLGLKLDGAGVATPYTFTGVAGILRDLEASDQSKNGSSYTFYSWSDGGTSAHQISTPSTATTYTATYLRTADAVSGLSSGVSYTYVEGAYTSLPNFANLTPTKTGTTPDFNLSPRNQDDNFAFLYKGYINVPTDGKYTFYTTSDDGSRLSIGGLTIVDNDGLHGATEKSGVAYLKAGKHAIEVAFFEQAYDQVLSVSYEGPGIGKQVIPASALFSSPTGTTGPPPVNATSLTLTSLPAGLSVKLDGLTVTTPYTFTSTSGSARTLEAVDQPKNGWNYTFGSWSDGGGASHQITTPGTATTYTVTYLRAADAVSGLSSGVSYTYVEGAYTSLPNFANLTPTKTGTTSDFNLSNRNQDDNFAFLYKGYIDIPTDGKYTFYTTSDDGSRLSIGGLTIVDNDGLHGATEKSGVAYLKAGKHAIEVAFFEQAFDQVLSVSYEGPGISKRVIPASALFSSPTGTTRPPDLTPVIYARPSTASGNPLVTVVVDVVELNSVPTSGLITVKISKDNMILLTFNTNLTIVSDRIVQNSAWSLDQSDPAYYVLSSTQSISAGNKLSVGLTGQFRPGSTTGVLSISAALVGGSGGEVNITNNVDADRIEYFP